MDTSDHRYRLLVIANQTALDPALIAALQRRAEAQPTRIHLVVPAEVDRLRYWLSDSDAAAAAAHVRVQAVHAAMVHGGVSLTVGVGDCIPMLAITDALSRFPADEVLISTLPPHRSHWLQRDLITRARRRFPIPITHFIAVDQPVLTLPSAPTPVRIAA